MSKNPQTRSTVNTNSPDDAEATAIDNSVQEQVVELQSTVAHLELAVESLDNVIAKQDKQLQDIQRQLQLMFTQLNGQNDNQGTVFDAATEIPPHY